MVLLLHDPAIMPAPEDQLIMELPEAAEGPPPLYDTEPYSVSTEPVVQQQQSAAVPAKSMSVDVRAKTCRSSIVLVCLMFTVGLAVSILGVFIYMLGSISHRDCAIWAGVPLAVTGIIGIYYCGHEFEAYASSMRAFVVKCVCLVLACVSCCTCTSACVFSGVHCWRILSFLPCESQPFHHCACFLKPDPLAQLFIYANTHNCSFINGEVWKYLLTEAVLNGVGSIITLCFLLMVWKSRYHGFYAGLKFYSYSATSSHHPSVSI